MSAAAVYEFDMNSAETGARQIAMCLAPCRLPYSSAIREHHADYLIPLLSEDLAESGARQIAFCPQRKMAMWQYGPAVPQRNPQRKMAI